MASRRLKQKRNSSKFDNTNNTDKNEDNIDLGLNDLT